MTEAASTLHPKSRAFDDIEMDDFIRRLMHLNSAQKARILQMLGGATWPTGAGVGDDTAQKNQRYNREQVEWLRGELEAAEEMCREAERQFTKLIGALEPAPSESGLDIEALYGANLISGVTSSFK